MPECPQPSVATDPVQTIRKIADGFAYPLRAPILHTPDELGLEFTDVTFPASDGVPIEAWFIPRAGSDRLVICNHPLNFNRYGCPTDVEPFLSLGEWGGNDFEVNYMEDYRILHQAEYNVLTFDQRDMGRSGSGNGLTTSGRYQARDMVGAIRHARIDRSLSGMTVGLFARCNGANATFYGMHTQPDDFRGVRCLVACQPLSVRAIMTRSLESQGLGDHLDELEAECRMRVGYRFDDLSPIPWARDAVLPTLVYQVREDRMTFPADVQAIFDAIPTEKQLYWIESTSARWDGYLEFQRRPGLMLEWFARFM